MRQQFFFCFFFVFFFFCFVLLVFSVYLSLNHAVYGPSAPRAHRSWSLAMPAPITYVSFSFFVCEAAVGAWKARGLSTSVRWGSALFFLLSRMVGVKTISTAACTSFRRFSRKDEISPASTIFSCVWRRLFPKYL